MAIQTESVKVETTVMQRVRGYVTNTKPRINMTAFVSNELEKVMNRIEAKKKAK